MVSPRVKIAPWQKWTVYAGMCLGIFVLTFATTAVTNTMITIRDQMHMDSSQLQWTLNAYILAAASFIIVSGILGDRYGKRNIFVLGSIFFMAGSVVAALSTTPIQFIIARLLQGVGAAIVMPGTLAMMKVILEDEEQHLVTLGWACAAGLGLGTGPLISGVLLHTMGWPVLFWLTLVLMFMATFLLLLGLHQHCEVNDNVTIDQWGLLCYLFGFVPFVFAFVEGNSLGWNSTVIITLLLVGAFFMILQYWVEKHVDKTPLINFEYFKKPRFLLGCIGFFVNGYVLIGIYFFGNIFLQNQVMLNFSSYKSGFAIVPVGAALFIASLLTDKLIARLGNRRVNQISMTMMIIGTIWFLCLDGSSSYNLIWEPFVFLGFGGGIAMKAFPAIAMAALSREEATRASSLVSANMYIGGIFSACIGTILMLNLGRREFLQATMNLSMPVIEKIKLDNALMGHPASIHKIIQQVAPTHEHEIYHAFVSSSLKGFHYAMISMVVVAILGMLFSIVLKKKSTS